MKKSDAKTALILEMLDTIEGLGYVQSARIDARLWWRFYLRKAARLGLISKPKNKTPSKRK